MGFFPCMKIRLERTGDKLIAEWYDEVVAKWNTKTFRRTDVPDAMKWLEEQFTQLEM